MTDRSPSYHDLAGWYDALYDSIGKDYTAEADALLAVAAGLGVDAPSSLLDVACGTGRHLEAFAQRIDDVAGLDASPAMLALAAGRLGQDAALTEGDLRAFDLGRTFDVVTCLFSSIGHVHDGEELDRSIVAMARHLPRGGVLLVEPWLTPAAVQPTGHRGLVTATSDDGVVARASHTHREGDVLVVSFAWAVATTTGTATLEETHRMPLFEPARYLEAVQAAGLDGHWLDEVPGLGSHRGLLVGRRAT